MNSTLLRELISEPDQGKIKGIFELKILIFTARDNIIAHLHASLILQNYYG